jgi:hypothetical protein
LVHYVARQTKISLYVSKMPSLAESEKMCSVSHLLRGECQLGSSFVREIHLAARKPSGCGCCYKGVQLLFRRQQARNAERDIENKCAQPVYSQWHFRFERIPQA